jgi:hypothetical protein
MASPFQNLANAASKFGQATASTAKSLSTSASKSINNIANQFLGRGQQSIPTMQSPFVGQQPSNQIANPINSQGGQSNKELVQALKDLTSAIKQQGKGTPTGQPISQVQPNISGMTGKTTGGILSNIGQTFANIGGMTMSGLRAGSSLASQSTAAGLLSQVPLIGGMLAAPFSIYTAKAGGVSSLEQLNRRVQFGGGNFAGSAVSANRDLYNFAQFGMGPAEALGMQLETQGAGLGRFMTSGPNSQLAFGTNLSQFARMGFSGTTAGLFQGMSSNFNANRLNQNGIFGFAANAGFSDNMMQTLAQSIRSIQSSTTMNLGGGLLNNQSLNNLTALGLPMFGAETGGVLSKIYGASANITKAFNPYSGLVGLGLQNEAIRRGGGNVFETFRAQEQMAADPIEMVKQALRQSGGNQMRARDLLVGEQGLTTGQVELLMGAEASGKKFGDLLKDQSALQVLGEKAGALGGVAGVQVSKRLASQELEDTTLGGKIANALKENREVERNLLKNQVDDTKQILEALKTIAAGVAVIANIVTELFGLMKGLYEKFMNTNVGKAVSERISQTSTFFKHLYLDVKEYLNE